MGCDIHGCWEVQVPDGRWFAFRTISDNRSYAWFGIMSGVRGPGPKCDSERWDPTDADPGAEIVCDYWREICTHWGGGIHSHTAASFDTVRHANDEYRHYMQENWDGDGEQESIEYETLPRPDDHVQELWLGVSGDDQWEVNSIPMNIPLSEVMGLPPDIHVDDERFKSRLRYLCAYDN